MKSLKVAFLDVGHGDFIYAVTPLGDNLIIDLGTGNVVPSSFLKPITQISELQISHPHTDHFDDIIEISKKEIKSFRCLYLDMFSDKQIGWRKEDRQKICKLREIKKSKPKDDNAVKVDNDFKHIVWPPKNVDSNNPNTASLVTILAFKYVKILFGGDLPASGWETLLEDQDFVKAISGTTIFKVSHHGRNEGCCDALFKYIKPKLCIISDKPLDKENRKTESTSWYSQRTEGCKVKGYEGDRKVLTTRNDGSIFVYINERGWDVYPNKSWIND